MTSDELTALAAELWNARRKGLKIPFPPGLANENDAYSVQDALIQQAQSEPAGWKAGATGIGGPETLGLSGPFIGPLWEEDIYEVTESRVQRIALPGVDEATVLIEIEVAFKFGAKPRSNGRNDVLDAVTGAAVAFEILGNRFATTPQPPGRAFVADHAGNAAVAIGAWHDAFQTLNLPGSTAVLTVNGRESARGDGQAVMGDPVASLCWLTGKVAERGHSVEAGQIVISGAIIPMTAVDVGAELQAELTGMEPLRISVESVLS